MICSDACLSVCAWPTFPAAGRYRGLAAFWPGVDDLCREQNAVFLRVEPEIWEPVTPGFTSINLPGFAATQQNIQPPPDRPGQLEGSEDDLLGAMKSKTRTTSAWRAQGRGREAQR